jgi:hypothetical protein
MSSKTVLRPRVSDLQSGDPKLQDLHRYALHLLQGQDPLRTAHNASLLFLTVVNAFQHAGITDLDWVPSLYIEVASREYEVRVEMTEFTEKVLRRGWNCQVDMGRKLALSVFTEPRWHMLIQCLLHMHCCRFRFTVPTTTKPILQVYQRP